jgi:hypothetical protein
VRKQGGVIAEVEQLQKGYLEFEADLDALKASFATERSLLLDRFRTKICELEQDFKIKEHEYLAQIATLAQVNRELEQRLRASNAKGFLSSLDSSE